MVHNCQIILVCRKESSFLAIPNWRNVVTLAYCECCIQTGDATKIIKKEPLEIKTEVNNFGDCIKQICNST